MLTKDELINKLYLLAPEYDENFQLIFELATEDHPVGCGLLGACYQSGYGGMGINPDRAFNLYKLASDLGFPFATARLGACYEKGFGCKQDVQLALELYKIAGINHPMGLVYEADFYTHVERPPRLDEAFRLYKQAADQEFPLGICFLGICYASGNGVPLDEHQAFELYKQATTMDYPLGYSQLGKCYEKGIGVPKNNKEAVQCYKTAFITSPTKYRFETLCPLAPLLTRDELVLVIETAKKYYIDSSELDPWVKSSRYEKLITLVMNEYEIDTCSICFEPLKDELFMTRCLHVYHRACVYNQISCPLCRADFEDINCT